MHMNKKAKLVMLLSASALGMALTSCDESASSSSSSSSSSSVAPIATRISYEALPYLVTGQSLDLDKYITIKYDDNSTDKTYNVECSDESVTITDHKVVSNSHGTYTLVITAGAVTSKIELNVVSEDHKSLIDLVSGLEEHPQNYLLSTYDVDSSTGKLVYEDSYVHNENYIAIYDEDDPAAVYPDDSKYAGQPASTLLAKLSDGHAYWGNFTKDATGNVIPVFEPGYASWDNYYITGGLSLDATDATYETGTDGTEYLLMGTGFEQNLLHYGLSTFPENYKYTLTGAEVLGVEDLDEDGDTDTAVFACYVSITQNGKTSSGYWTIVALSNIGSATIEIMESAITDAKYLPTKIKAPEISNTFAALAEKKNYTLTTTLKATDGDGEALELEDYSKDTMANLFGGTEATFVTSFTEDGVISTLTTLPITKDASGNYVPGTQTQLGGKFAIWDDGTNTYTSSYDSESKAMGEKTTVAANKQVYDSGALKGMTADTITEADANGTIWSSKQSSGTKVTFTGQVGDYYSETEVTNELFGKLLDMNGFSVTWFEDIGAAGIGTQLTTPMSFTSGDKHALSLSSSYNYFIVDTATNEVSMSALCYLPIGLSDYITITVTISNVGTTTNDFTNFVSGTTSAE